MNYVSMVCVALAGALETTSRSVVRALSRLRPTSAGAVLDAAFEQSPHGSLLVDARTLRIVAANAEVRRLLGLSERKPRALTLAQLFSHDLEADALIARLRDPTLREPVRLEHEDENGVTIDIEISGYAVEIRHERLLYLTTHDVTSRTKYEARLLENQQRLAHLAHHDQLTGLPNRLFLAAHLPGAIDAARHEGRILAILFLDLDRFKHINDSRGHETGDQLLKAVAQRLRATVRDEDVVVRMGGDEFIVLLEDIHSTEEVNEAAARIIDALSNPVIVNGRSLVTTVSIGVSLYPRDGADMGELLRHSDTAMYQAKERGRNNCQIFSPVMDRRLKQKIAIEQHLRAALESGQLDVYYQPIVDVESNRVVALESLLRWKHPQYGYVPPDRFIAIAEETGLIIPIGEFVLERVLQNMSQWRDAGCTLIPVAINVSAVQLQRSNLAELIVSLTRASGLRPSLLQIELTESAIFERRESRNGESSRDAVAHLRDLGVQIAIDDFGTGYSSLSYLKRWRFDYLKIDRTFVRDLVTDMSDLAIVGAIIAMARHLHIPVIAEGIEGWQQLEKLRELGCALAQGHLFARPTSARKCRRYLSGEPVDLVNRDRRIDLLDSTDIGPIAISEILEGARKASG
ncbi:MAG TPA: EAL domain-containing protein [Steroidobacteraceae bacterium]